MKTKIVGLSRALAAMASVVSARGASLGDPAMAGHWTGTAQIVVNWTVQRTLAVDVTIASDCTVTGTVGDAKLSGAKLLKRFRFLGLGADYVLVGKLDGDIIASEKIHRDVVKFPLHWIESRFQGGLQTSGTWFGGKKSMILTAGDMKLQKEEKP